MSCASSNLPRPTANSFSEADAAGFEVDPIESKLVPVNSKPLSAEFQLDRSKSKRDSVISNLDPAKSKHLAGQYQLEAVEFDLEPSIL